MSVAQLSGGRVSQAARRASRRDPLVVVALVVLAILVVIAVVGPILAPYDPNQLFVGPAGGHPTLSHPFGTDDLGRDILSRILAGGRVSLFAPVFIVLISSALGLVVSILAAWFRGWVDGLLARVIDVVFAIPGLVMAVLAVAMFGKGVVAPIVALSIAYMPILARLMRAAAMTELGKPYIAALRIQGLGGFAIFWRHLIPALLPTLLAQATVGFGYSMLDLAAISYLGLGQQPPTADWGVMISAGQPSIISGSPEQSLFPAALIVITVLAVNVVGARMTVWAEGKDR
ncbi:ABC transporter permease [Microbacterium horticulturae]|uniref:ABC transporter permease n=1 Tax=Microbacterium horticulturae TaxID=3028316 RepID=A0ABY8C289_9MICO|nr:ABC transporter permease [Microbacterium sp. KACC 23027]WEG09345.1 ABC transporter permease [Microbacterium sp. KACC 23027]